MEGSSIYPVPPEPEPKPDPEPIKPDPEKRKEEIENEKLFYCDECGVSKNSIRESSMIIKDTTRLQIAEDVIKLIKRNSHSRKKCHF